MRLFLGFFTHCGFKAQGESFTICSKCKKVESSSRSCFSFVFPLQIYYCEYYEKYLEEYERRRLMMMNENSAAASASSASYDASNNAALVAGNVEASILMDDIMNNGMTFCSIM